MNINMSGKLLRCFMMIVFSVISNKWLLFNLPSPARVTFCLCVKSCKLMRSEADMLCKINIYDSAAFPVSTYTYLGCLVSTGAAWEAACHLSICRTDALWSNEDLVVYLITHHYLSLPITTYHYLSLPIITYHYLSLPITTYHYLSLPITTYHYLSLPITTYHYLSLPITTYHYLSLPITTYHYLSLPIITYHHLSLPITTYHYLSLPITTYHYLSLPITTYHYLSLPITTYHYLSPPIITYHYLSLPIITYHHLSLPITTYHYLSLPITTYHYPSLPITTYHYPSLPITTYHYPSLLIITYHYLSLPITTYHYLQLFLWHLLLLFIIRFLEKIKISSNIRILKRQPSNAEREWTCLQGKYCNAVWIQPELCSGSTQRTGCSKTNSHTLSDTQAAHTKCPPLPRVLHMTRYA